MTDRQS